MIKERLANLNEELRKTLIQYQEEASIDIEELTILDIRQHYSNLSILNSRLGSLLAQYKITELEYANP